MITLYRKHVGVIGSWRIWATGDVIHIRHSTVLGGAEVRHTEVVTTNQSGRSLEQQIELRIKSRIGRMLDRGYKYDIDDAQHSSNTNQLGLLRPMLAQPKARVSSINYKGSVLQKKLDGHRCMITRQDGEIIAYSRQGKPITSIKSHILDYLTQTLPEGITIDGELYIHGLPLQTIASYIKRLQPETNKLNFVAYDLVSKDSYKDRHAELTDIINPLNHKNILVLPYHDFQSHDDTAELFTRVRGQGFEGLMLRLDNAGYEEGRRSNNLIKIKAFEDDEFKVIGVVASSTGWGVCKCKTSDGKIFDVSAPGTHEEKRDVLVNIEKYVGKLLTVQFANYTSDGIPFQPVALQWRDDV